MAGVTMGDRDSGGMIPMGVNGGGAMDGRTAVTAHGNCHEWRWQQWGWQWWWHKSNE